VSQLVGARFQDKLGSGSSESARAKRLLNARFPTRAGDSAQVVFHGPGDLVAGAEAAAIHADLAGLTGLAHVDGLTSPLDAAGRGQVSADHHTAFATVQFDNTTENLSKSTIQAVVDRARAGARPGLEVEVGGQPIGKVIGAKPGSSEGVGVGAAIVILLVAFGSVIAMGLPIGTAMFGIAAGFGLLDLLSRTLTVPTFGPELAAMVGIGVGIDYALFIVTRYRQGLHEGRQPDDAVVTALDTAGRAVLFAGCTVIISLLGMLLLGEPFVVGLAFGAIGAVLMVLLASLTLLPALLGFTGLAIDRLHVPRLLHRDRVRTDRDGFWWRWSRVVQRRPWVAAGSSLAVLIVLAVPLFSMHLAFTDQGNDPTSLTTRRAYDLLAAGFGAGSNGPLVIGASVPAGATGAVDRLAAATRAWPDVAFVAPPTYNAAHDTAVILVIPGSSPQAQATQSLVHGLRRRVVPAATAGTGVTALVGGETAAAVDSATQLGQRLPYVIGGVVLLSFLLLMAVFRSIAVPIKAAVMNLLSIGAAYGVIVAVFSWGWLGSVFGIGKTGPIEPWVPLMLFTILFGLSMDYEVFLLSRIREEWLRTSDNATSVADGLAATARVITAAAAIMVCVFGSFVIGDDLRVLKLFGLGLATAVFVDATLVRMVLVPATMELLGGANWWFPRWLDRAIPELSVEGDVEAPRTPVGAGAGVG